jgi:hypothetical protein
MIGGYQFLHHHNGLACSLVTTRHATLLKWTKLMSMDDLTDFQGDATLHCRQ